MMKKLLSYALPFVAAAGITGCSEFKPEFPAAIIKKASYSEIPADITTCLYDEKGKYWGAGSGDGEVGFGLEFSVKIQDPNGIRSFTSRLSNYKTDKPTKENCEYTLMAAESGRMVSPKKAPFEKHPLLTYTVTDCKGNVKEYKFTLDELIKQSAPLKTLRIVEDEECPEKLYIPEASIDTHSNCYHVTDSICIPIVPLFH